MEPKKIQYDQPTFTVDNLQEQSTLKQSKPIYEVKSQFSKKLMILMITFLGALLLPRAVYYIFINQPLEPTQGPQGVLGMLFKQVEENRKIPIKDLSRLQDSIIINTNQKDRIKQIQIRRKELLNKLNEQLLKKDKQSQNIIFQLKEQFDLLTKFIQVSRKKDTQSKAFEYHRVYLGMEDPIFKISSQPNPLYIPSRQEADNYNQKNDLILYTPAGRKVYIQLLYQYLSKQKQSFNRWHLWVNTDNNTDIEYMEKLANENDWIKIITLEHFLFPPGHFRNIRRFWRKDCEKNKVYLRVDDDTVWMSPDFVDKMFNARIKDLQPIFIFANIINNGVIEYAHQRAGNFIYKDPITYDHAGNAWNQSFAHIAKQLHLQFLESAQKNQTDKWKTSFNKWYALNYERISINALIYFTNTINSMQFSFKFEQEQLFSSDISHYYERKNYVLNDPVCVHHAFYTQRQFMNNQAPQILVGYQKLAGL